VRYHHLLLPRHEVILVNGVWAESLHAGAEQARGYFGDARVAEFAGCLARPCLKQHEVDALFDCVPVRLTA
jgi:hypothetical protein